MPSRPRTPLVPILVLMLAAILACQGVAADKKIAAQQSNGGPTLQLKDGDLTLVSNGAAHRIAAKSAQPYRLVVSGANYSLVTTCGSDLQVATYSTDGVNVRKLPDMLPQIVLPPVCALAGLASSEAGGTTGVTLLGPRGEPVWRDAQADLLWPVTGKPRSNAFCISAGSDTNPLGIYGLQPTLKRIACPAGTELWNAPLATENYVEDAILYGIGSKYGLLGVQYGVELHEFFTFDVTTGSAKSALLLEGAPLFRRWYPGPIPEPLGVELNGDDLTVTVLELDGGWKKLTFNLSSGSVKSVATKPLALLGEHNPHPDGGIGAAKPPLFPQGILPMQFGAAWTIPALMNPKGQVFVVAGNGASWVTP